MIMSRGTEAGFLLDEIVAESTSNEERMSNQNIETLDETGKIINYTFIFY